METFLTIIHVIVALFMILVVLVQGGNSGGISAAFGGGNSQGVFGAGGATSFLGKLTYGAAAIFMLTSISLTVMQGTSGRTGLKERLQGTTTTVPDVGVKNENAPAQPAAATAAPTEAPKPATQQ